MPERLPNASCKQREQCKLTSTGCQFEAARYAALRHRTTKDKISALNAIANNWSYGDANCPNFERVRELAEQQRDNLKLAKSK